MAADAFGERSSAVVGLVATALGTMVALGMFPDNPTPKAALVWNASVLSAGILFVPLFRAIRRSPTMMNTENFVAFGYVYWVLFDLIQGAYDLRGASDESLRFAMLAVGVSAMAMWLGAMGSPWKLPKWLVDVASRPLDQQTVRRLIPFCFFLGMLNYAYATNFNIPVMFFLHRREPVGRSLGPRTVGRLGIVHRSDAVLRLCAAESDRPRDLEARVFQG